MTLRKVLYVVIATLLLSSVAWADAPAPQTQVFQKTTDGGIQQVTANDPKDQTRVATIRKDLEAEAARFGTGDYSGTLAVKYLAKLKPGEISIIYRNVGNGAAVDYKGNDAAGVSAVHDWIDAQIDAASD